MRPTAICMRRLCIIGVLLALVVGVSAHGQGPGPWVVFDPGHGGSKVGSLTPITGYYEKDVNLDVALLLKEILDFHGFTEDVHYVFTRVTDTTVPNDERAYIANGEKTATKKMVLLK